MLPSLSHTQSVQRAVHGYRFVPNTGFEYPASKLRQRNRILPDIGFDKLLPASISLCVYSVPANCSMPNIFTVEFTEANTQIIVVIVITAFISDIKANLKKILTEKNHYKRYNLA